MPSFFYAYVDAQKRAWTLDNMGKHTNILEFAAERFVFWGFNFWKNSFSPY